MSSIVLDLQAELLSSASDIVGILRKAHVIAYKLGLTDFDKWISCELNGYKDGDDFPEYRIIRGTVKALNPYRGWVPVHIPEKELDTLISTTHITNSVSEIIELRAQGNTTLLTEYTGAQLAELNEMILMPLPMRYALHYSAAQIYDIIEKVKNTILEWTIKLEAEGILGENLQFNVREKEAAKQIPQLINNYYYPIIANAPISNSAIASGEGNTIQYSESSIEEAVSDIEEAIEKEHLSEEQRSAVMTMLSEIKDKVEKQEHPGIIKSCLVGVRDFLISAGASAAVAVIQAKMQGLF